MKRIFSNGLKVILAVMFSAIAVSCDEDVMQATVLSGKWQGDWGMYYQYEYRGGIRRAGRVYTSRRHTRVYEACSV